MRVVAMCVGGWMDGWMDGMDGWMDGWMGGWMDVHVWTPRSEEFTHHSWTATVHDDSTNTPPIFSLVNRRLGEAPPGRRSGHWTGLLTLLATLTGLESLQVTHAHAVFPLAKCLGFRLTDRLAALDLSHVRVSE